MSLKKNTAYSITLTLSNYVFPLIIFPYVARILGVENIGICNWVDSIITYFVMFSMMGMEILGVREIAYNKEKKKELSQTFFSLLSLNAFGTVIAIIILSICIIIIPAFNEYKELFYIGSAKLFTNLFLIEWFYKGTENFKYITSRSILVKLAYMASIFILVQERDDYPTYYLLTVLSVVVTAIWNIIYSRKFVTKPKTINPTKFLRPCIFLGAYILLNALFSTFNVTYLGLVYNKSEVGIYTTVTKIFMVLLSLYTACTTVIMPKMSNMISQNDKKGISHTISKAINLLYTLAFPLFVTAELFTPEIIHFFGGIEYVAAIPLLRILLPMILILGLEQILVIQILMPFKADKQILINSLISAGVGITFGSILIKYHGAYGSAITWIIVQLCVFASSFYFVQRFVHFNLEYRSMLKNAVYSTPYILVYLGVSYLPLAHYPMIAAILFLFLLYFYLSQYYLIKNPFVIQTVDWVRKKLQEHN